MSKPRWVAGGLLVAWAAFWAFFAYVQVPPAGVALTVAVVLFAVPLLAWWWRQTGGVLLVLEGLGLLGFVLSFQRRWDWTGFLFLTLVLPPLIAGMLLLGEYRADFGRRTA